MGTDDAWLEWKFTDLVELQWQCTVKTRSAQNMDERNSEISVPDREKKFGEKQLAYCTGKRHKAD